MEIASGSSLRRPDFEVVLFEGTNPLRYAWYMAGVLCRQVQKMKGVRTVPAQCVEIVTQTHLQIDGEYAGRQTARLEIAPDALTLLMPPEYK
jgi:diacylglycerol kinase family enzyme